VSIKGRPSLVEYGTAGDQVHLEQQGLDFVGYTHGWTLLPRLWSIECEAKAN